MPRVAFIGLERMEQAGLHMKLPSKPVFRQSAGDPPLQALGRAQFFRRNVYGALRRKDAAYAVALAESLLSADPIMGARLCLPTTERKRTRPTTMKARWSRSCRSRNRWFRRAPIRISILQASR